LRLWSIVDAVETDIAIVIYSIQWDTGKNIILLLIVVCNSWYQR
jgi:hypothetical protein